MSVQPAPRPVITGLKGLPAPMSMMPVLLNVQRGVPRGIVGEPLESFGVQSRCTRQPTGAVPERPEPGTGAPPHSTKYTLAPRRATGDVFVVGGSPPPPPPPPPPVLGSSVGRGFGEGASGDEGEGTGGVGLRIGICTTTTGIGASMVVGRLGSSSVMVWHAATAATTLRSANVRFIRTLLRELEIP